MDRAESPETVAPQPETVPSARRRLRSFRVPVLIFAMFAVLTGTRGLNVLAAHVPVLAPIVGLATAAGSLACYRRLSRTVELRSDVPELAPAGRWNDLRRGAVIGSVAFTTTMLVIGMFGGWQHVGGGSIGGMLVSLGAMASVAVNEELLFRGVIFRILEERTGTVIALVVSCLLFGLIHLVNPDATLAGTLASGLEGGLLTAAAYVATRSLWLPIGIHFGWNFAESGIFGTANSGTHEDSVSLLHTTLSGSDALTGGSYGPEAGLVALLACLVPAVLLLRRAARTGQLRPRP
jgi:membrane protease YdiL (CAAX protease family)